MDVVEILKDNYNIIMIVLATVSMILTYMIHTRKETIISDYKKFFIRTIYIDFPFIFTMFLLCFIFAYPFKDFAILWILIISQTGIIFIFAMMLSGFSRDITEKTWARVIIYVIFSFAVILLTVLYALQIIYVISDTIEKPETLMIYGILFIIIQSIFVMDSIYDIYDDYIKYRPLIMVDVYLKSSTNPIVGRLIDSSTKRILLEVEEKSMLIIPENNIAYLKIEEEENDNKEREVSENA